MRSTSSSAAPAKTVVIVDPDPAVRHSLEFALGAEGYGILSFARGRDLIAVLGQKDLHCTVTEYQLPDMSGLDLIAKVREVYRDVPALLLVTNPDRALQLRARDASAMIVEKPLIGGALIDKIHDLTTV